MTSFDLKIIACISMFLDHFGYFIFGKLSYLNYIGRLAFPIFAFQLSEGYLHTKNLKKYYIRIIIFALFSQIPYMFFKYYISNSFIGLNIGFTLILGLIAITLYDKSENKLLGFLLAIICSVIAYFLKVDYNTIGVPIIFSFYFFKNNKVLMAIGYIAISFVYYIKMLLLNFEVILPLFICSLSSIVFILLYNGKQGKKIKYFLYIFYPVHLTVLCLLFQFFRII